MSAELKDHLLTSHKNVRVVSRWVLLIFCFHLIMFSFVLFHKYVSLLDKLLNSVLKVTSLINSQYGKSRFYCDPG